LTLTGQEPYTCGLHAVGPKGPAILALSLFPEPRDPRTMKSERRHELQTNYLADWLGNHIGQVRPYSKMLMGVLVIIAVLFFAVLYLWGQRSRQIAVGWDELYAASAEGDAGQLDIVARNHPGTLLGEWASQMAGDNHLRNGVNLLTSDRDEAYQRLRDARDAYESVINETEDAMLKQRATMGLAQVFEATNEVGKAEAQYQSVIKSWPNEPVFKVATERLEFLKEPSTRGFLTWFSKQKPRPAQSPTTPGSETKLPSIYDDLPGDSDLTLPDSNALPSRQSDPLFDPLQPPTGVDSSDDTIFLPEETPPSDDVFSLPPQDPIPPVDSSDVTPAAELDAETTELPSFDDLDGTEDP
jgi:hypothetical protein